MLRIPIREIDSSVQILLDLAVEEMGFELFDPQAVPLIGPNFRVVDNSVSSSLVSIIFSGRALGSSPEIWLLLVLALDGLQRFLAVGLEGGIGVGGNLVEENAVFLVVVYHAVLNLKEPVVVPN